VRCRHLARLAALRTGTRSKVLLPVKRRDDPDTRIESLVSAPSRPAGLTVVKLGGSQAFGPHLKAWLSAIAAEAGAIVVTPGGGPFADAVRDAQDRMGFDNRAAHAMALMAMAQFGHALQNLEPRLQVSSSRAAIRRALKAREVPVWAPEAMALAACLPETWELTSDSLAAWLAGELKAAQIVLIKHGRFDEPSIDAERLAALGVVDPLFPRFLKESRARAWLAAPEDSAKLTLGLRRPLFPEILA
jgi:aspartokinase-like uncharacterized kinase